MRERVVDERGRVLCVEQITPLILPNYRKLTATVSILTVTLLQ